MRKAVNILFIILTGFFLVAPAGTGNVVTVKTLEIRGLKYMTKAELIQGVRMKAMERGLAVDLDSLHGVLAGSRFIRAYTVRESGDSLVVSIEEKEPVRLLVVKKGDQRVAMELDESGTIISVNRVHRPLSPAIVIGETDIVKGTVTAAVKELFGLLDEVRAACPVLYGQMELVDAEGLNSIGVRLRGRKTLYRLSPDLAQFTRLQYLVGYLDRKGAGPASVVLSGDKALVRQ